MFFDQFFPLNSNPIAADWAAEAANYAANSWPGVDPAEIHDLLDEKCAIGIMSGEPHVVQKRYGSVHRHKPLSNEIEARGLLRSVAFDCVISVARRKEHRTRVERVEYDLVDDTEGDISGTLAIDERRMLLEGALQQLTPIARAILLECFWHGRSVAAICADMRLEYSKTDRLKRQALDQLRNVLRVYLAA